MIQANEQTEPAPAAPVHRWRTPAMLLLAGALAVTLMIAIESVTALAIVVLEGAIALSALTAAGLAGGWVLTILGQTHRPWRERLIIGAALGIGSLSLITLALGLTGWLNQVTAWLLVAVLGIAGLARFVIDLQASHPAQPPATIRWFHGLWLAVCPFLVVALLAACLPPGVLWQEEGFGYDVLEYHLAVPKTFHDTGYITFLPNNIYSNFPLNSEMLSLLMMSLRGDAIEGAYAAQLCNVLLACLFVAAAWLAGRTYSPTAGVVTGVLAGTLPWIAYLAGIAYVEAGMLAMAMCCLTTVLIAVREPGRPNRQLVVAGLFAGLAAGFKYTAIPMIALPAGVLVLLGRRCWSQRLIGLGLFIAAAAVTLSPWLIRNLHNTDNPFFPLAYSIFGARADTWDDELQARWTPAHGPAGAADPDISTIHRLFDRTIGDFRMGAVVAILATIGTIVAKDRWSTALPLIIAWQILIWTTFTHQYARFAVVMLPPMILLATRAVNAKHRFTRLTSAVCGLLVLSAAWNLYRLADLYYHQPGVSAPAGTAKAYGRTVWFLTGQWPGTRPVQAINRLDADANVMLVGEARTFYVRTPCEYATVFNHHPLAQAVRSLQDAGAIMQWLRDRGTTHVLVNWHEMRRLRQSYGFYPEIDAALFDRLGPFGLKLVESFEFIPGQPPYATLFEVTPNE